KQAFNLPSPPIATKFSSILSARLFSILFVRCNQFNATLFQQFLIKRIAIVRLVTNQFIRSVLSKAIIDSLFNKLYFVGRSASNIGGDRKTKSVCDCHDLGAFAAL